MIILGIDPGTARIGYGVIKKEGKKLLYINSGLLTIPKTEHATKLIIIEEELTKLIQKTSPARVGIEKLFFAKNRKTALEVAEARGIIIATISKQKLPIIELTPPEVKLAVTGNGTASKEAVAKMVSLILKLDISKKIDDVTDALGIAIAISNNRPEFST